MKKFFEFKEEEWDIEDEPDYQKVRVYISMSGDYCAFHEVFFSVVYDVTNNKKVGWGEYTLQELKKWEYEGYTDVKLCNAIKIGKKYYVEL